MDSFADSFVHLSLHLQEYPDIPFKSFGPYFPYNSATIFPGIIAKYDVYRGFSLGISRQVRGAPKSFIKSISIGSGRFPELASPNNRFKSHI